MNRQLRVTCVALGAFALCSASVSCIWAQQAEADPQAAAFQRRVQLAEQFLCTEMDRWTTGSVVVDGFQTGGAAFFPSNWMGDVPSISFNSRLAAGERSELPYTQIVFSPPFRNDGWAAVGWAYPDNNFGNLPGRDITGATRLSGLICGKGIVTLKIGYIPDPDQQFVRPQPRFRDPFGKQLRVRLGADWARFELRIPQQGSRKGVVTGFVVACDGAENPSDCVVNLCDVAYDDAHPNMLRFIRSYVPVLGPEDDRIRQGAHLYDQAICLQAFLARGDAEGKRRARMLADAMCWAQAHDRFFKDGRWRNAYSCGPLEDPATGGARLPGIYNEKAKRFEEDWYAVGSDTGNLGWAIIALASFAKLEEADPANSKYLRAAVSAAEWIEKNCRADDKLGGYTAGFEGPEPSADNPAPQTKLAWRSTEHNLDCAVAFEKLALLTGAQQKWHERSQHARKFVLHMWQKEKGFFWTGTKNEKREINELIPADGQTWAILALGHDPEFREHIGWLDRAQQPPCLAWLEQNLRVVDGEAQGYRFSDQGKGIWAEGCAHLAACYQILGNAKEARRVLLEIVHFDPPVAPPLDRAAHVDGPEPFGGIMAAYRQPAATGFLKKYGDLVVPWTYKPRQHIGATAWFVLAGRRCNPYWPEGAPNGRAAPEMPAGTNAKSKNSH